MRIGEANRLHKDNFSAVMVSKTGDANFASAGACWDRLIVQYPADPIHQPKLVAHAFRGAAATVFQQIAAANTNASAQTLRDLMKGRLNNTAQVKRQRARFTSATMKKDEYVEEFAERLRQLACGLPETTTNDVLLQRLRDGLPSALKFNALAVTGEFDTVVSQVRQIAVAMAVMRPRREQVNAVGGAIEHTNGKRKGISRTVGTSDEEWIRNRTKPRGSREIPVGSSPNDPEDIRPWNRARKCFRCHQWGHVRIGSTQECRWPDADPENGEEGERGETSPLKQGGTDGGETERKGRQCGVMGE
jgi:Retrotransposon gag protein